MEIAFAPPNIASETLAHTATAIPSPRAFYQEGTKIINSSGNPDVATIMRTVGMIGFETELMATTNRTLLEQAGKTSRIKVLSLIAARSLAVSASEEDASSQAIDYILTDPGLRTDIRVKAAGIENSEASREIDASFIREYGGKALERRFLDETISRDQAISLAFVFQQMPGLGMLDRARAITSLFDQSMDLTTLSPELKTIRENYQLAQMVFVKILGIAVPRRSFDKTPLSIFSGEAKTALDEIKACSNTNTLKTRIGEILGTQDIPTKIDDLRNIVGILKQNPDIKAVSFDLYDTLVQWTSNQGERRGRMDKLSVDLLKQKYGINVNSEQFHAVSLKAWERRWVEFQEKGIEVDIKDTLGWMVDGVTLGIGPRQRTEIIHDLEKTWYKVELETAAPMPGALDTLRAIKALGVKTCLTSNASWSEAHLRRVLTRFGLLEYFDAISYSNETGRMKHQTDPSFFHYSWGKLGVRPEQVLHVGDNPWADQQGARNAGAKSVLYDNPSSFVEIETHREYWESTEAYANKAYEFFRRSQNQAAIEMINGLMEQRKIPLAERERLGVMAREVYQKTRDVVAPAYIALSETLLQRLAHGESDINLCLARDGLPMAIAQKLLLHYEPERYPGVRPDQIRYLHVSRRFLERRPDDPEFAQKYADYVARLDVGQAQKITITDLLSGSGKTHEGMKKILQGKQVDGFYIDSHQRSPSYHSLLNDTLGPAQHLSSDNMLILFETLFSGPYESAADIINKSVGYAPELHGKHLPPEVLVRGLSEQSILLLNRIAIRGIIDSVETTHRRRSLGMVDQSDTEIMSRFYAFINNKPTDAWVDIWRTIPWQDYGKWYIASENPIQADAMASKLS
jgi:HAD superfamily hydrolase (TIGR01549 family)